MYGGNTNYHGNPYIQGTTVPCDKVLPYLVIRLTIATYKPATYHSSDVLQGMLVFPKHAIYNTQWHRNVLGIGGGGGGGGGGRAG